MCPLAHVGTLRLPFVLLAVPFFAARRAVPVCLHPGHQVFRPLGEVGRLTVVDALAHGERRYPSGQGSLSRSHGAREGGEGADVLAKVDPRDDEIGPLRDAVVIDGPDDGVRRVSRDRLGRVAARRRGAGRRQTSVGHLWTGSTLIGKRRHHDDLGMGESSQCLHGCIDPGCRHPIVIRDEDGQTRGGLGRSPGVARHGGAQGQPGGRTQEGRGDDAGMDSSWHVPSSWWAQRIASAMNVSTGM